jgi:hypothetical protein
MAGSCDYCDAISGIGRPYGGLIYRDEYVAAWHMAVRGDDPSEYLGSLVVAPVRHAAGKTVLGGTDAAPASPESLQIQRLVNALHTALREAAGAESVMSFPFGDSEQSFAHAYILMNCAYSDAKRSELRRIRRESERPEDQQIALAADLRRWLQWHGWAVPS